MQPRMWFLGCKCTGKHLDLSLRVCSQSVLCPVCACTQECLVLGAGPTLGLVLQGFCTCIPFQAFQGPFWMAFLPSSVLSAPHNLVVNLLMVPSIPCCWQMLNNTCPNTDLWGTPLILWTFSLCLAIAWLTASLWVQLSSQFLIHPVIHCPNHSFPV